MIERWRRRGVAAPAEPPARLHGDLWSGNVLWAPDGAWLIDPAAHGGHRETDLAMLALFGCPHLDRVLAAYDEAAPLADGWRDRVPLHQLFPLLVHVVLFGRGYAAQAWPRPARPWARAEPARVAPTPPRAPHHPSRTGESARSGERMSRSGRPRGQAARARWSFVASSAACRSVHGQSAARAGRRPDSPCTARGRRRRARRAGAQPCPAGRGSSARAGSPVPP